LMKLLRYNQKKTETTIIPTSFAVVHVIWMPRTGLYDAVCGIKIQSCKIWTY
jgi:hypothetical protein